MIETFQVMTRSVETDDRTPVRVRALLLSKSAKCEAEVLKDVGGTLQDKRMRFVGWQIVRRASEYRRNVKK